MFTSYFSNNQLFWLVVIVLIHVLSIFYFLNKKNIRYALLLLFAGELMMRLLVISFDSFLHPWDEQYHALIASNMAKGNSIVPTLYENTPLPYDPHSWTSNHVWLHKQP